MATGGQPFLLSNGEYVINAAAAASNRALVEAINAGRITSGTTGAAPAPAGPLVGQITLNGYPREARRDVIAALAEARYRTTGQAVSA
jgi:hypothetical protein